MKSKSKSLFHSVVFSALAISSVAQAASGTWTSNVSGNWLDSTKWTSGNVPNAASEIATLGGDWTGQTITVTTATVGQILASDSASATGGLTISGGTLTLNNGASAPIISTGANSNFSETAALRFKISSVLDGTNGFERQGSGYLDLSGVTNIFTGTVRLTAPSSGGGSFTVINSDANLGNSANVITVALNSQPVGFYNDGSAGAFTLNSARTITTSGTGDFWVKNKTGANMTIAGIISGTARLRKNDSGTLTLTGANSYNGGTFIEGGTLVLSGGNNRLLSTSSVTFGSGSTLDVGATSQTLGSIVGSGTSAVTGSYTVNGVGGKLLVNGDVQFTVSGSVGTVVNMAGLSEFEYNRSTKNFLVQPTSIASPSTASTAELRLAADGMGKNTITAAAVTIGTASASGGADNVATMRLGKDNTINTGTIQVGGFNGRGTINFNTGLTTPTLKLRGVDGTSAMTGLNLGQTSSGTRPGTGVLDLTGGSLDALVTDILIGNNTTNITDNSSLTMPAGTLIATTLTIGQGSGTSAALNGTLNNSFSQGGGSVSATTLTMGNNINTNITPQTPIFNASYNLSGGTLYAGTIQAGAGTFASTSVRKIAWTGGTIANLNSTTDLTINGVSGAGGSIIIDASTATTKNFAVETDRKMTLGANTSLTGAAAISKTGNGTLVINGASSGYTGTFTVSTGSLLVNNAGGFGSTGGAVSVSSGATLGGSGSISVATTITSGGIHTAGDKVTVANALGTGTISNETFTAGITYNSGSIFEWNLTGDTATTIGTRGTNYDAVNTSALATNGAGAIFRVVLNAGQDFSESFWDSNRTWTNIFTNVAGSSSLDIASIFGGGFDYRNSSGTVAGVTTTQGYFTFGGAGHLNELNWTAVPEPNSALAGLLITAGLLRRRRRA